MKVNKKILGLALSFAFLPSLISANNTSYAASTNSAFYRSSKTRSFYLALTDSQRAELDMMNTDNKYPLTIEEVLNSGKYSIPIVKGRDWLYPFMIDRNKDGQVGENYFKGNNHINGSSNESSEDVEENIAEENIEENIAEEDYEDAYEETTLEEASETENTNIEKEVESEFSEENAEYRTKIKVDLEKSIEKAKTQVDACESIIKNYPKTIKKVKGKLLALLEESKAYIKTAEELLKTL